MDIKKLGLISTVAMLSVTISLGGCDLLKSEAQIKQEAEIKKKHEAKIKLEASPEYQKAKDEKDKAEEARVAEEARLKAEEEKARKEAEGKVRKEAEKYKAKSKMEVLEAELKEIRKLKAVMQEKLSYAAKRSELTPWQRLQNGYITLAQYDEIKYHERHPYGY